MSQAEDIREALRQANSPALAVAVLLAALLAALLALAGCRCGIPEIPATGNRQPATVKRQPASAFAEVRAESLEQKAAGVAAHELVYGKDAP
jgi:hypothetical protein